MKLNSQELNKLLDQVSDDVAAVLAKAEEAEKTDLKKANPGEETPGEETPSGSSAEGSAPQASPKAPEAGSPTETPEESPGEAETPAPASTDEQTQNPATEESSGPEALVAEYAKLPIEELKMHVMAAHAALMQAISSPEGGSPQGASPEGTAPEAAPGVAPEGSQPEGQEPPMGKKEMKSSDGNGGKIVKSEKTDLEIRLETLEKSLKEKEDTINTLETKFTEATDGLKKFVEKSDNQALRKSISGISFDKKPGSEEGKSNVTLSKSEAVQKLNALTSDPDRMGKLAKSERESISQYILGNAPQTVISHLLK